MSTRNDHEQAIREACERVSPITAGPGGPWWLIANARVLETLRHAEALARQLAEAEADCNVMAAKVGQLSREREEAEARAARYAEALRYVKKTERYKLELSGFKDVADAIGDLDEAEARVMSDTTNEHVKGIKSAIVGLMRKDRKPKTHVEYGNDAYDHLDALARQLAEAEARAERYRAAFEAEFAYNMLAIVQDFANPEKVTAAAQLALDAWCVLRDHGDPVSEWQGYQPGDLPGTDAEATS
jgi:hypothetical protein